MGNNNIKVDVVIPVYRASEEFGEMISRLEKQKMPVNHIYLMHTEDRADWGWLKEKYENIDIIPITPEEFDHGATRDRGIKMSEADIVICMTQDAMPVDSYLTQKLLKPLENPDVAAAYARQIPRKDCNLVEQYIRTFNYPASDSVKSEEDIPRLGIKTFFCSNVCAAYKKEQYLQLGGFEARTIFNEDMIFAAKCIRNGWSIAYAAGAKVIHSHNYSKLQQFRRNFDIGVSQVSHPEIFSRIPSEKEGIRMLKSTAVYLIRRKHPFLVFSLVFESAVKYLGFQMGKHYRYLPKGIIKKFTLNPRYWNKCR